MKKIYLALLMCVFLMVGCGEKKATFPEELVDKDWLFYDGVAGESLVMNFHSDGTYSYHCSCGEPVGNSDLYELYEFDPETSIITLSNDYDDNTSEIEVICYNEHHMMVKVDGEIKDFNLVEFDTTSNFYWMEGEQYFSGYQSFSRIIEMNEEEVKCAPLGYDSQGMYSEGPFETYKLAADVEYSELTITSWRTTDGELENEDRYEKSFKEFNEEDLAYVRENGGGTAFLWFNDQMEIEKVLFWGENAIVE